MDKDNYKDKIEIEDPSLIDDMLLKSYRTNELGEDEMYEDDLGDEFSSFEDITDPEISNNLIMIQRLMYFSFRNFMKRYLGQPLPERLHSSSVSRKQRDSQIRGYCQTYLDIVGKLQYLTATTVEEKAITEYSDNTNYDKINSLSREAHANSNPEYIFDNTSIRSHIPEQPPSIDKTADPLLISIINNIDKGFKCIIKSDIITFRGERSIEMLENRIIEDLHVKNDQLLSTSLDIRVANNFSMTPSNEGFIIMLVISANTYIIPAYNYSLSTPECEILLPRTSDIILIKKVDIMVDLYGNKCSTDGYYYTDDEPYQCNKIKYIFKVIPVVSHKSTSVGGSKKITPYEKIYNQIINYEYNNSKSTKERNFWKSKMAKYSKIKKSVKSNKSKSRKSKSRKSRRN